MKLTVPQAARRAGRNPETIRRWIWSGKLPSERVGNQHLVDEAALEALLAPSDEPEDAELVEVGGQLGEWWRQVLAFHERLRQDGVRLRPAAELIEEERRSH
jgi:excisionase family DNA binding protein